TTITSVVTTQQPGSLYLPGDNWGPMLPWGELDACVCLGLTGCLCWTGVNWCLCLSGINWLPVVAWGELGACCCGRSIRCLSLHGGNWFPVVVSS
ncbi:MAG: hypothetical protein VYE16_01535, partial [Cyanobacteriota bacterium]|nr:hypothetical protein [Cyanobacteriota bacterium]